MAGYDGGEAAVLTKIQGLTNFDANNTSRGDWVILERGQSTFYAILKPGNHTRALHTMSRARDDFTTVIEVWQMVTLEDSDTTWLGNLEAKVEEIMEGLAPFNRLGDSADTILLSQIRTANVVQEMFNDQGGLEWLMQEVNLEWWEERAYSYQDRK